MNAKLLILVLGLVVLAGGAIMYWGNEKETEISLVVNQTETEGSPSEEIVMEASIPERVVGTFMANFIQSAPPSINPQALVEAMATFSDTAKMEVGIEATSEDLARFVGVQDMPDMGYEIAKIAYADNPATGELNGRAQVDVSFNYSGSPITKTFSLTNYAGVWLIDKID